MTKMYKYLATLSLAAAALCFSGCEDPSGPQITMSGSGGSNGGYTATVTVSQTVYSGPSGTITAQASDKITRTDGGDFSQVGSAQVQYQSASSRFTAQMQITNIGGNGSVGGRITLGWKF